VARYNILFARSARKDLERLTPWIATRVLGRVQELVKEPRPPRCRKLAGADSLWRIRIGDYRVLYAIHDENAVIDVLAIRHRNDAYR
jgi:mRNA interferase RelE/StbE